MKRYVTIILLALVFLATSLYAATTDFTANSDVTVSAVTFGESTADMLILNNSTAESWVYNAGAFTITNPGTFKVGSSDAAVKTFRMTQGGSTVACALNTTPGTDYVTAPIAAATYTVVPSALTTCQDVCTSVSHAATLNTYPTCGAATCNSGYELWGSGATAICSAASSSGGGSSGGGGGGGGGTPAIPAIPAVPGISPAIPAFSALIHASPRAAFNRRLIAGSVGSDVKNLQQFLNSNGFVVATIGAGSPGKETTTFGPATARALIRYQIARGIIQTATDDGAGEFGPKTRNAVNNTDTATPPVLTSDRQALLNSLRLQLNQLLEQLRQLQAQGQQ